MTNIARAKPSIWRDCFRRLIRLLIISHHDRRALYLDLAIHDPHLAAVHDTANRCDLIRSRPVRGRNLRGTLRHAVALCNGNAKTLVIRCQIRCQVAAAADDLVKSSAKHLLLHLADRDFRVLAVQDCNAVIQCFRHHRNHADDRRLKQQNMLCQLLHIAV